MTTPDDEGGFFSTLGNALSETIGESWRDMSEFIAGIDEEDEEDVALSSARSVAGARGGGGYARSRSEDISLATSSAGLPLSDFPDLRQPMEKRGRELNRLEQTMTRQEEQAGLMRQRASELRQAAADKKDGCCVVL
jgi:hypothetical protein